MPWLETIAIVGLVGAAYKDWTTRTVSNRYWAWLLLALAPFLLAELAGDPKAFLIRILVAAGFAAVVFGLWLGQVFKAGDAKGLMVLGLALTAVGYYAPMQGRLHPAFDALPAALLVGEVWRRVRRKQTIPFFVVLLPVLLVTLVEGGLLWWPFVWIAGLIG